MPVRVLVRPGRSSPDTVSSIICFCCFSFLSFLFMPIDVHTTVIGNTSSVTFRRACRRTNIYKVLMYVYFP